MNRLICTASTDPWHNLALEELLFSQKSSGMTMYLWQNSFTVVIGRHQNAWKECRTDALSADGGRLARRASGGGAVFHDMGNLNFTFICPREMYDQKRQLGVIISAVRSLGIDASFTGRNDIVAAANGGKFSGNAFRFSHETGLHHGTLLVSADMGALSRYLAPSREKLASKGIESVRSRVVNLSELGEVSVPQLSSALKAAFAREYGAYEPLYEEELDPLLLASLEEKNASWEWRLGRTPNFDAELCTRFPWGELQLYIGLNSGIITQVKAYSDAMDEGLILALSPALTGVRFGSQTMGHAVRSLGSDASDIADWIENMEL